MKVQRSFLDFPNHNVGFGGYLRRRKGESMSGPNQFWVRLVMVFFAIVIIVLIARAIMLPETWGEEGYYRAASIDEEAHKALIFGTNASCKECHSEIYELKVDSKHQKLSCEICHAPVGEHAQYGEKFAPMPTKTGRDQIDLCMSCHQKTVGRPAAFPTIDAIGHLEDQKVKTTHTCDQCHTVHAPLENMNHVKRLRERTLKEAIDEN
jgi:hypothetical protein